MPKPNKGARLGGSPSHERLILANLSQSLFEHRAIRTTETKAKRLRPHAERLVTLAKRGDLASRRKVMKSIKDKGVVHALFTEIAPAVANRPGGYTRITKIANRKGDNAPMALIELVLEPFSPKQATVAEATAATKKAAETVAPVAAPAAAEGPYGAGSAAPLEDGSAPEGFDIKGNADSMKFHTTESPWYKQTVAEVWFNSIEAAEAAGFVNAKAPKAEAAAEADAE
ncbi:50S ribosomal protein L17 [Micrococcales bacterium 31B]|nr:50S ribosomal protein L17 [Micrococcales bacterium 31B]